MTLWVSHREENHPEDAEEAEAGVVSAAAAEVTFILLDDSYY